MNTLEKKRIGFIDCAKGITILLVVLGHTIGNGGRFEAILRGIIFSFHMPLFFILSSYTFRYSNDFSEFVLKVENGFKHLIIPVFILFFMKVILNYLLKIPDYVEISISNIINSLVYSSGVEVTLGDTKIGSLGMLWFLVVLFFSRLLFDYFQLKINNKVWLFSSVVFCSIFGVLISFFQWLPFCFDLVLTILPFIYSGYCLKKYDLEKKYIIKSGVFLCIFLILLLIEFCVCNNYLELACRRYSFYPVSFIIAIIGTLFVLYFSQILQKIMIFKCLNFLGKNSFLILSIHYLDYLWKRIYCVTENNLINGLMRCLVDTLFMIILYYTRLMIKKIYILRLNKNEI